MLNMECSSAANTVGESNVLGVIYPSRPAFSLCKVIPEGLAPQIESAVYDFIASSHLPSGVDKSGFFAQTLQSIVASSILSQPGADLWLGIDGGRLVAYVLGHIGNDYDGRLAYTVTQAWVAKDQRGKSWVKWAWDKIRQRAKDCLCKHFVVLSSRGKTKAYCRFLGKGFHPYAEILKEEL